MAKPGPTPRPDADSRVTRKRVPGVELLEAGAELPNPLPGWLRRTVEVYEAYRESQSALAVRPEDLDSVRTLFDVLDQRARMLEGIQSPDADVSIGDVARAWQTLKIIDGIAGRLASELGIGPLARARLGIKKVEGATAIDRLRQQLAADD